MRGAADGDGQRDRGQETDEIELIISRSNIDSEICSEKCGELVGSDSSRAAPNAFRIPVTSPNGVPKCARSPKNVCRCPVFVKTNPKRVPKNADLSWIMQAHALAEMCPQIRDRVPRVTSTPSNPEKCPQILHIWGQFPGLLVAVSL